MAKVKETELVERINKVFSELSPVEFVEEVNRILGTNYIIGDIEFGK